MENIPRPFDFNDTIKKDSITFFLHSVGLQRHSKLGNKSI